MRRLLLAALFLLSALPVSAQIVKREDTVIAKVGSFYAPAAFFKINVYEPGGIASANSSGATINLYANHGFAIGDKALIDPGGDNTFTAAVSAVSSTAIGITSGTYSVSQGDVIFNLGPDTGSSSPNYDGSTKVIYQYPGASQITTEMVTTDALGDYEYWYNADTSIWELIRTAAGTPADYKILRSDTSERVYNVEAYGASCDGVTNDSPAIQSAIDAANADGGGWVVIPPNGVCEIVTGLSLPRYVGLKGAGNSEIITDAAITMVTVSSTGTTATTSTLALGIEGLVIDGNDAATTGVIIGELDGFTIKDVTVRKINGWSVVWDKTQNAIAIELRAFRSNHGFEIVNEAGNVSCYSCETSEIDGHHIFVGDDATRANYSVGLNPPFQIGFFDSQIERQSENPTTTEMVEIDKASRFTMDGCGIVMLDRTGGATMTRIVHIDTSAVLTRLHHIGINNQMSDPNDTQVAIDNDGEDTTITFPRFVGYGDAPNDVIRSDAKTAVYYPTETATFCTTFATCDPSTADLRWEEVVTAKRVMKGNNDFYGDITVVPHAGDSSVSTITAQFGNSATVLLLENTDTTNEENSTLLQFRNGGATNRTSEDVFVGGTSTGVFRVWQDDGATAILSATQAGVVTSGTALTPGTFLRLPAITTLTIASDAATVTQSFHNLAGQGGVSDDLATINGGTAGDIIYLRTSDSAQDITLTEAGNLELIGTTCVLDNVEDVAALLYTGAVWLALSCADNGA